MLKMAWDGNDSKIGLEVTGKYGKYYVKEKIGNGGNGEVFAVEIIDGGDTLPKEKGYAIKFLTVSQKNVKEVEKRKKRFEKEIRQVVTLQNSVEGILPIYDASIYSEDSQKKLWYLMPIAKPYEAKNYSIKQRLEHMLQLGESIMQLHAIGYAHRDIKPKNLLMFKKRLYLSDFGLVWNINDQDEHITEAKDCLGPKAIRPPELQSAGDINDVDYRKSDVYLYAKTLWMILYCNNSGFFAEYLRNRSEVYIDKNKLKIETAEPLHCLMEEATKYQYWERADIDTCVEYVRNQLQIANGDISEKALAKWKYMEQINYARITIPSDECVYRDSTSILRILNSMVGAVGLVFVENGKEYGFFPLRKVRCIQGNLFEIAISNPYYNGRKKIIELAFSNIRLKKDMSCTLDSNIYMFDNRQVPVYTQIIEALQSSEKRVRLNAIYLIQMVSLE